MKVKTKKSSAHIFSLLYEMIFSTLLEGASARFLSQHTGRRVEAMARGKGAPSCPSQSGPGACPDPRDALRQMSLWWGRWATSFSSVLLGLLGGRTGGWYLICCLHPAPLHAPTRLAHLNSLVPAPRGRKNV